MEEEKPWNACGRGEQRKEKETNYKECSEIRRRRTYEESKEQERRKKRNKRNKPRNKQ